MAVNFKSIPPINQVLCFVGGMAFGMNRRWPTAAFGFLSHSLRDFCCGFRTAGIVQEGFGALIPNCGLSGEQAHRCCFIRKGFCGFNRQYVC
jgi:hypothetical protein